MKTKHILIVATLIGVATIFSCSKTADQVALQVPHMPDAPYKYTDTTVIVPVVGWGGGSSNNTPTSNKTTDAGAALGRVLFYDKVLSMNNTVACGSCHKQQFAFADNGAAFSTGFQGKPTARNSIGVWNERMNETFFFDGRATTLEEQTLMPVENHVEMGMEAIDVLPKKLKTLPYYAGLFTNAFGSSDITKERIAAALAQFMRSMTSLNSKFDAAGQNSFSTFSQLEKDGMACFSQFRCISCHSGLNLNGGGSDFANIGLDTVPVDAGLMKRTGQPSDAGRFRVPSLRNVALTAPYMHDGRYKTLDEVLNHYSGNIVPVANLDPRLTNQGWGIFLTNTTLATQPIQMNMTAYQKQALIAFLNTLTDYNFIHDQRFADPFK